MPAFLLAKADPQLLQAIWGAVFNDSPSDDAADPATQPKTPEEFAEVRKLRGSCRKFAEGGQGASLDTLVAGFLAERKHGPDPHLTAEQFLGLGLRG